MTDENNIPVGGDEPLKPTHSLPRYSEPTPETHRKVTREEEAELALKNTAFTPGSRRLLILLFLVIILFVPAIQFAVELRTPHAEGRLGTFNIYKAYPAWEKILAVRGPRDIWRLLPRAAELKAVEEQFESESVVSDWLLPRVQSDPHRKARGRQRTSLPRPGRMALLPARRRLHNRPTLPRPGGNEAPRAGR